MQNKSYDPCYFNKLIAAFAGEYLLLRRKKIRKMM